MKLKFFTELKIYILKLIKVSFFKKIIIRIKFLSIMEIYNLNKKYKIKNNITNILTFNFKNISIIILNYTFMKKYSKIKKIKFFQKIFFDLIHCFLHSQNYKDKKFFNKKIMFFLQNLIIIKFGFLYFTDYRIRTCYHLITNQKLYQIS